MVLETEPAFADIYFYEYILHYKYMFYVAYFRASYDNDLLVFVILKLVQ